MSLLSCSKHCLTILAIAVSGSRSVLHAEELAVVHSQPSYQLESPEVSLAVTRLGGHLAPVTFYRNSANSIQPYHISPWQDESQQAMPAPVLVTLRGDFFCLPFGGNSEAVNGEQHPPHGETASEPWQLVSTGKDGKITTLKLSLTTRQRAGQITKELSLVDGQNFVYSTHTVEGFSGSSPVAHHATLSMPEEEGTVRLATSPIKFGLTYPGIFSDPKAREYQSLLPGAKWSALSHVPLAWKGAPDADLTRLPARTGYADLVQLANDLDSKPGQPAWAAATFTGKRYVWLSLKDSRVLNSTVLWIENHGRHGYPWNGRNHCLGIEDTTSYFADGLAASIKDNALTKAGVATSLTFNGVKPAKIRYIQGVVQIPQEFDHVADLVFRPGELTLVAANGRRVTTSVDFEYVFSGEFR